MRSAVFAFTERGKATACRVAAQLTGEIALYAPARLAGEGFGAYTGALPEFVGTAFDRDALIFVGATGIAIRAVAPHVASKRSDPAVIGLDEAARYVLEADDVAFFGIEQNYFQGQLFAYKLRQIGIDCVVPRREEAPLVAKGLGPGGCAVIVSYSGLSNQRPPSSYVEDLRERHVPTIGVTNSGNNWLRRNVDCALTFRPREHFVSKIASFYGERATNLVLDALFSRCFAAHYDANVRRKLSKVVAIERKLQVKDVLPE